MNDEQVIISEDVKAEMTAAAGSAARVNRPRWVLGLGGVALVAALAYASVQIASRASAEAALASERRQLDAINQAVADLRKLAEADRTTGGEDRTRPDNRMLNKITQAARDAGLAVNTEDEGLDPRANPNPNLVRRKYTVRLVNQPAEPTFNWLRTVTTTLPGVQLNQIELKPGTEATMEGVPTWNTDVIFTRWEQKAS